MSEIRGFEKWANAALSVAGTNGMSDDQVIPTWPEGVDGPELTIGMVKAALGSNEGEAALEVIDGQIVSSDLPSGFTGKLYSRPAPVAMPDGLDIELIVNALDDYQQVLTNGELDGAGHHLPSDIELQGKLLSLLTAAPATDQHPDDAAVDRFAAAMKAKLAKARDKGRSGWDDPDQCSVEFLADLLLGHIGKGNPGNFEDIANLAMMLHQRGAEPSVLTQSAHIADARKVVASNWKTAKHGQHWPHIGGKYLIKLNGVLQHEIYEFDQGDDGMGGGEYFWDREDLDEAAPFDHANDEWLPIDEAGIATPSVPENEVLEYIESTITLVMQACGNSYANSWCERLLSIAKRAGVYRGKTTGGIYDLMNEWSDEIDRRKAARLRTAGDEGEVEQ